jgi:hypothetical protein
MHAGDYRAAMASFREALRLDAQNEWARQGLAEAMKGGSLIYRPIHRFYLWTSRLTPGQSLALFLSFPIANRVLRSVERTKPELAPVLEPIIYTLLFFVYLTWIAEPASNFVLLLHPVGRMLLSSGTKRVAVVCGALLVAGIAAIVTGFAIDDLRVIFGGVVALGMVIPIHGTSTLLPGHSRSLLWGFTLILALAGAFTLLAAPIIPAFILGVVVYTWIRTGVAARQQIGA